MTEPQNDASVCLRCGRANQCAVVTGATDCWCKQLPVLRPTLSGPKTTTAASAAVCYCPACLAELTTADGRQQSAEAEQYKAEGSA